MLKSMYIPIFLFGLNACSRQMKADAAGNLTMTPSVTYLHLLRHTPFFTSLTTDQLRWTINHSKEWQIKTAGVIATNKDDADYWVLLDGGWQLSCNQNNHHSKHDEAGKWFNPRVANKECQLIATSPSYVMRIKDVDMQDMLNKGFDFRHHLDAGFNYYHTLFSKQI